MTTFKKLSGIKGLWFPQDPDFRKFFSRIIKEAIDHMVVNGDTSYLSNIANSIENPRVRYIAIQELEAALPIKFNGKGFRMKKGEKKRERARNQDWSNFNIFTATMMKELELSDCGDGYIKIKKGTYSMNEFMDLVLDTLTTGHGHMREDDIEELVEISKRIADKKSGLSLR